MPRGSNRNRKFPYVVNVQWAVSKTLFVQGLEDAGFDLRGSVNFIFKEKNRLQIIFRTGYHGVRVVQAFAPPHNRMSLGEDVRPVVVQGAKEDEQIFYEDPATVYRDPDAPIPSILEIRVAMRRAFSLPQEGQASLSGSVAVQKEEEAGEGAEAKDEDGEGMDEEEGEESEVDEEEDEDDEGDDDESEA